jgi:DNA-binding response OmpR family regulator
MIFFKGNVMKIVLLSDDESLIDRISWTLSLHNFIVDAVPTTEKLESYMEAFPYDLMIFDASTPNLDILPYAKEIQSYRSSLNAAVII